MSKSEERRRVLDLLAAGSITVDQASDLLKALGPSQAESLPLPPPRAIQPVRPQSAEPPLPPRRSNRRRFVRIHIDSVKSDGSRDAKVHVNVPMALAKFALRFVPADARSELETQGIDIGQLLDGFDEDLPDGKLLDLTAEQGDGGGTAHITIEVI